MTGAPAIVAPAVSAWTSSISVLVENIPADIPVRIETTIADAQGAEWRGFATFKADGSGRINSATSRPLDGTYDGIDAMGLFWSVRPHRHGGRFFTQPGGNAQQWHLTVSSDTQLLASKRSSATCAIRVCAAGKVCLHQALCTNRYVPGIANPRSSFLRCRRRRSG